MGAAHLNESLYGNDPVPPQFRPLRRTCRRGLRYLERFTGSSTIPVTHASPVRLGLCSYTFRNFDRAQMIAYMKQLNVLALNAKDVKDHLPMDPTAEAKALDDYDAAGIQLHAAGAIYFPKDEDDDIRSKFEYCKRAGIKVIVAGDPTPATLPRIEKFVKEYDIRSPSTTTARKTRCGLRRWMY